jgi:hypothetical protein
MAAHLRAVFFNCCAAGLHWSLAFLGTGLCLVKIKTIYSGHGLKKVEMHCPRGYYSLNIFHVKLQSIA